MQPKSEHQQLIIMQSIYDTVTSGGKLLYCAMLLCQYSGYSVCFSGCVTASSAVIVRTIAGQTIQ